MVDVTSDETPADNHSRRPRNPRNRLDRRLINAGVAAIAGATLLALGVSVHHGLAQDNSRQGGKRTAVRTDRSSFQLFSASSPTAVLDVNALICGVDDRGNICFNNFNSPTGGAGYWPGLEGGQYIFNSGLQLAGINSAGAGPWAGDTVGAYVFDERGAQQHGTPLTPVFDSRRPEDVADWPPEARISDTDIFSPDLISQIAASEQDTWVQYWEGDPSTPFFRANREHPIGLKVTQRSLAWNAPLGNESIIYFIVYVENVTADPDFQELNELEYFGGTDALPDEGWTIESLYAAVASDPDVTSNATQNFSAAVLPFEMGFTYHGGFLDQTQTYPPAFFRPPFFRSVPGFVGAKFLSTPLDDQTGLEAGLRVWSGYVNPSEAGATSPISPLGPQQLWKALAGRFDSSNGPGCLVPATTPTETNLCFVSFRARDSKFYQSAGPFSLDAGETETLVFAWIVAAAVETMPDGSPSGILVNQSSANSNPPGIPSVHPGFPSERGCDSTGQNCTVVLSAAQNAPTSIDRATGWYRYTGPPPADALETSANKLDPFRVEVVPESLLGKALLAQTVFDYKFVLATPPVSPEFFLAPGDNNVAILWERSPTETTGDPFHALTSDPNSALFNPNYRWKDVEGYRVYRGTRPDNLELIAQFDYESSTFTDYTCETVQPFENVGVVTDVNGVPTSVLGYMAGEDCPLESAPMVRNIGPANPDPRAFRGGSLPLVFNNGKVGGPPGGGMSRVDASPVPIRLDTVRPGTSPADTLALANTGVPFVFADTTVTSNFTYYYAVTAFDVNSLASGAASLESPVQVLSTVPRVFASNLSTAFEAEFGLAGDDGVVLDETLENVQPDPLTGVFPGPQPPTNSLDLVVVPPPEQFGSLLTTGALAGRIDSIVPRSSAAGQCPNGTNALSACWEIHTTFTNEADGNSTSIVSRGFTPVWDIFGDPDFTEFPLGSGTLQWDDEALRLYGIPAGFGSGVQVDVTGRFSMTINYSSFEGQANRRFSSPTFNPGIIAGGSRWFDGETETLPDPTRFIGAGRLAGIDTVWKPVHHTPVNASGFIYPASDQIQCFGYTIAPLARAADVRATWAGGTFTEVRDVTHNVDVPFSPAARASYGFLSTDSNGNGALDWQDFDYLDGVRTNVTQGLGFCAASGQSLPVVSLGSNPTILPTSTQGNFVNLISTTGQGFALYINAERYIFETSSLPSDGTVWTLRTYSGLMEAGGTGAAPTNYSLTVGASGEGRNRPPMITGLEVRLDITQAGVVSSGKPDLAAIHTVPDPYLGSSRFDIAPTKRQLMFVNMPAQCTLRVYSLSGVLIRSFNYRDQSGGGRMAWDMTNRSGQAIASGVYFFQVTTPEGDEHVGRFTVVTGSGPF